MTLMTQGKVERWLFWWCNTQAEAKKDEKLRAWLAIKTRFRGLILGTAIRVSGRLMIIMVYEFPDQPGNLKWVTEHLNPPLLAFFFFLTLQLLIVLKLRTSKAQTVWSCLDSSRFYFPNLTWCSTTLCGMTNITWFVSVIIITTTKRGFQFSSDFFHFFYLCDFFPRFVRFL